MYRHFYFAIHLRAEMNLNTLMSNINILNVSSVFEPKDFYNDLGYSTQS